MEIRQLSTGERPPQNSDSVTINVLPNGKAGFSGVYLAGTVTAHTISRNNFASEDEALKAALEWAEAKKISILHLSVDRSGA